ncbi:hypothetical protein GWK47_003935 [Chionoecetes opilio]|uniref:Uncharacterized protein n=1 Tax=Chionoecetes opilio TaxID=41210 RepID=A0A8J4YPA6_CHIOP|nr:hypothetical protein GWK47_003935 [Chionoecetes opilio]
MAPCNARTHHRPILRLPCCQPSPLRALRRCTAASLVLRPSRIENLLPDPCHDTHFCRRNVVSGAHKSVFSNPAHTQSGQLTEVAERASPQPTQLLLSITGRPRRSCENNTTLLPPPHSSPSPPPFTAKQYVHNVFRAQRSKDRVVLGLCGHGLLPACLQDAHDLATTRLGPVIVTGKTWWLMKYTVSKSKTKI